MSNDGKPASGARRGKGRPWLTVVAAAVAVLLAVFYVGGGWFFSGELFKDALDAQQRRADLVEIDYELKVADVREDAVTFEVPDDDIPNELLTGEIWGLRWDGGYGQVGAIIDEDDGFVTREFVQLLGPPLNPGTRTDLTPWTFPDDPLVGLGVAYEDVNYPGELGEYPAWFVSGSRDTWMIIVHGNSMSRLDGLRILSISADAGFPSLVITYRNDPGAPEDPSGLLGYGAREWRDVESAVRYAIDQGADKVILAGYSQGGAAIINFAYESPSAEDVVGLVLDAPIVDFGRAVDLVASRRDIPGLGVKVPQSLTSVAKLISSLRYGFDWSAVDYLSRSDELTTKTLIIHGTNDLRVPIETSRQFAEDQPQLVRLAEIPDAEHTQSWNIDRQSYERAVLDFMEDVAG